MSTPLVDVLIPAFNAVQTLDASMDSMARQSLADIRIVVVDDGSTDRTPELLAAWSARDPRVVVLAKQNGGIVSALNHGLSHCTAEFVARFDADDIAYPNRLEAQLAFLRVHPDHVGVGCDVDHIDEHGASLTGLPHPGPPENADASWIAAREPYLIHPFAMMRRAAIMDIGGYRPSPNSEDTDLYWRLEERGRLHNLPERLGQYRMHSTSISGASIVNGRVMAVGSQLSALSALRRRLGAPDIAFAETDAAQLKAAQSLAGMIDIVAPRLTAAEIVRLRLAAGIKLLELAHYRPYEIDRADAVFIRAALADWDIASTDNRGHIRWHIVTTAGRLARKGKLDEALALTPPAFLPRAAARALLGSPEF
ncbi:MAG: glycosyltransferase [Alphaproteobacteria bacterium]